MTNELCYIRLGVSHLPSERMFQQALKKIRKEFHDVRITNVGLTYRHFYDENEQHGSAAYLVYYFPKPRIDRKKEKLQKDIERIVFRVFKYYTDKIYLFEGGGKLLHEHTFPLREYMERMHKEEFNRYVVQEIPGVNKRLLVSIARSIEDVLEEKRSELKVKVEIDEDYRIRYREIYPYEHMCYLRDHVVKEEDFERLNVYLKGVRNQTNNLKEGMFDGVIKNVIIDEIIRHEQITRERNARTSSFMEVLCDGISKDKLEKLIRRDEFNRLRLREEDGKLSIQVVYPYNVSPKDNVNASFKGYAFDLVESVLEELFWLPSLKGGGECKYTIEDDWVRKSYDAKSAPVPTITYKNNTKEG